MAFLLKKLTLPIKNNYSNKTTEKSIKNKIKPRIRDISKTHYNKKFVRSQTTSIIKIPK